MQARAKRCDGADEGAHTVRSATDSACSWDHPLYGALTPETKASGKKFGEKETNFFDASHFSGEGGGRDL